MASLKDMQRKLEQVEKYLKGNALTIIGTEAKKHFKQSFVEQGFTDKTLEKWDDVKRRDPTSPWYGFQAGATSIPPNNHPKRAKAKKPYKQRKEGAMTNYQPGATKRKILTGTNQNLMKSIDWKKSDDGKGVIVEAKTPYAEIQNEGGEIKVFGKATAEIKARKFMGDSQVLKDKLTKKIVADIQNILK